MVRKISSCKMKDIAHAPLYYYSMFIDQMKNFNCFLVSQNTQVP